MKLVTANKINRLWKNGVLAKMVAKDKVLNTAEEIEANTSAENVAGALVAKELYNNLMQQPEYIYDPATGKITGYKTPGCADTVFPFSSVKSEKNIALAAGGRIKINLGFKPKYICLHALSSLYSHVYIFNSDISDTSQVRIWAQVGYQNGGVNTSYPLGSSEGFYDITDDGFSFLSNDSRTSTVSYFAAG